jgi:hypothetical protein
MMPRCATSTWRFPKTTYGSDVDPLQPRVGMAPGVAGGAVAGLGGECRHGNADLLRNLTLAAMAAIPCRRLGTLPDFVPSFRERH